MASLEVENYKKSYEKILDRWAKKIEAPLKEIEDINKELETFDAKKGELSEDEQKRYKELMAQRKRCQGAIEKANMELKVDLMLIEPPTKASKDEFEKLVDWIKGKIKKIKDGLPLGGGFYLKPDVEFDFKKLKFKKQGLILEWRF